MHSIVGVTSHDKLITRRLWLAGNVGELVRLALLVSNLMLLEISAVQEK